MAASRIIGEIQYVLAPSTWRGRYGSLLSHIDRLVAFGQGLIEPRKDELILNPVGQPLEATTSARSANGISTPQTVMTWARGARWSYPPPAGSKVMSKAP